MPVSFYLITAVTCKIFHGICILIPSTIGELHPDLGEERNIPQNVGKIILKCEALYQADMSDLVISANEIILLRINFNRLRIHIIIHVFHVCT